jgi:uncharacterized protein (DUF1778 family)
MTKKNTQIAVRLANGDSVLLKRICKSRGEDISDFVRRAIRSEFARLSFLRPAEKKALGIGTKGE